ncbi:RICIN domain-containing protein [Streptomyces sp. ISL-11]|uniref:RICIN domain-containing protein n=1 Tax=Streptomyces sp. ISL-11 TaxID=2819174 RepID=UPI001BE64B53|nr:RICIN domain-containing protein [Streptomyces sp. ISL-11]MBT2382652.1 ricin-type beta-trefoil lectin domain protein [Streptomyces sp. ISL-11]
MFAVGAVLGVTAPASSAGAARTDTAPEQRWTVGLHDGTIRNSVSGHCLTGGGEGGTVTARACGGPGQQFTIEPNGTVRNAAGGRCLTSMGAGNAVTSRQCASGAGQKFTYTADDQTLRNSASGLCVTAEGRDRAVTMRPCRD